MDKIKLFVMDVDGTLTDGKINMGENGELFKSFDVKDGYGIHEILPHYQVKTVIITGRESEIVNIRAKELEVNYICQGIKNKLSKLEEIISDLEIDVNEIAYIGDDIIDLECIKVCGVSGCPADAAKEIKDNVNFVSMHKGGEGAVRDFIEWLKEERYV